MKFATEPRELESSGVMEEMEFSIEVTPQAMEVLSGLYSDIPWAIVREYGTNMLDAYVKLPADQPRLPPEIHVPSAMEPWITFRDYGVGMSEKTLRTIFTRYFASTKRDNDDEVGGLGLGAKTAFCYDPAEAWVVESRHAGKLMVFHATKNEKLIPALNLVAVSDTTEHSGVTIQIPVAATDIERFKESCARLLRYYPIPITTTGSKLDLKPLEYALRGSNWGLRKKRHADPGHTAVMGNVPYPVTQAELLGSSPKFDWRFEKEWCVDVWVKVGDLRIVPSRESLMYTPKTRARLAESVKQILEDLPQVGGERVAQATSLWDAMCKLHTVFVPPLSELIGPVTWNGQQMSTIAGISVLRSTFPEQVGLRVLKNGNRTTVFGEGTLAPTDNLTVHPAKKHVLIVDTLEKGGPQLVRRYMTHECSKSVSWKTKRDWTANGEAYIFKGITAERLSQTFGGCPVQTTAELAEWEKKLLADKPDTVFAARKPTKVRKFMPTAHYGDRWLETTVDAAAGGFWVSLFDNRPTRENLTTDSLKHIKLDAITMGYLATTDEIFGIPRSCETLERKSGWKDVCAFIEGRLRNDLTPEKWAAIATWSTWSDIRDTHLGRMLFTMANTQPYPSGYAGDLLSRMKQAMPNVSELRALTQLANAFRLTKPLECPAIHDGAVEFERLLQEYPMLRVFHTAVVCDLLQHQATIFNYLNTNTNNA